MVKKFIQFFPQDVTEKPQWTFWPTQYLFTQTEKNLPAVWETWIWSLDLKDPLEEGKATDSSNLAKRMPWTETPVGLQSKGSQRVEHDWAHIL